MSARRRTLSVSPLAMLTAGTMYAFGIYSDKLKDLLNLSNTQTNIISLGANIGNYLVFPAGFWFDRYGPKSTTAIGGLLVSLGYFLLYLRSDGYIGGGVYLMAFFAALFGHGGGWIDAAVMGTNIGNYKDHPHLVSGFIKTFFGLSASMLALFYDCFFYDRAVNFLLFLSIFAIVDMIPVVLMIERDDTPLKSHGPLDFGASIALLVLFTCGLNAVLDATKIISPPPDHQLVWYIFLGVIWFSLLSLQSVNFVNFRERRKSSISALPRRIQRDFTAAEALGDWKFWFVFFITTCATGAGLTMINNITEIYKSLHNGDDSGKALLVSLLGICNALGRLTTGAVFSRFHIPTAKLYACSLFGFTISFTLLMLFPYDLLYVCSCLIGLFYGSCWVVVPTLVKDFFGTRYFGSVYTLQTMSAAAGSLLFSTLLAGQVYDHFAIDNNCEGVKCFQLTYIVIASSCCFSAFLAVILHLKTRHLFSFEPLNSRAASIQSMSGDNGGILTL